MPRDATEGRPDLPGAGNERRTEYGTILSIENGVARVRVDPGDECHACNLQGHCHSEPEKHPILHWPAPPEVREGQRVAVHVTKTSKLGLASLIYLLPLVTSVAGALIGGEIGQPEATDVNAMIGFAVGLAASALVIIPVARAGTRNGRWELDIEPCSDDLQQIEHAT